jgi:hypothetical protein
VDEQDFHFDNRLEALKEVRNLLERLASGSDNPLIEARFLPLTPEYPCRVTRVSLRNSQSITA